MACRTPSPRHVWVFLGLLDACAGLLVPRTSFVAGSPGRAVIRFSSPGIENTTTLLLSDDGATLYVGARDAVLSLDVSQPGTMTIRSKIDWSPAPKELQECTRKGKSEMDCHNFVRVLQLLNATHIYACGTFAFNPTSTFIDAGAFSLRSSSTARRGDSHGRCPFDPHQRSTAIAVDGELYTGTTANFFGDQPVISRFLSDRNQRDLKLEDVQNLLTDPTFISTASVLSEGKVYYFFRETGMEYEFLTDYTVSRIAQVCKSDTGGKSILQKRWTTFAKAQLRCQAADTELPFNVIQDLVTLPPPEGAPADDTLFYGVFSSQWSLTAGRSAMCSFRLGDIKKVFAGNYKTLNRGTRRFDSLHTEKLASPGKCGLHNASDAELAFVKDSFLAEDSVRPAGQGLAALVSRGHLYDRIAALRTRAVGGKDFTVLFLLTESGFLHKTVLSDQGPHIIEEIQVFKQPQSVKNVLLSLTKGVVFVGSSEGVFQMPVSNCSFYTTCGQCVLARDPFCGWDPNRLACAGVASIPSDAAQDVELGDVEKTCGDPPTSGQTSPGSDHSVHSGDVRSYYSELLVVTLLLVASLCMLMACAAYIYRQRAQDVDLGDVKKTCDDPQSGARGSADRTAPSEKFEYVLLSEVVSLHCPRASSLAQLRWERPDGGLLPNTFQRLENGGLSFLATRLTLGTYRCVSLENGYEETLAVVTVKLHPSPRSFTGDHRTPVQSRPSTTARPIPGPVTEAATEAWAESGREEAKEDETVEQEPATVTQAVDDVPTPIDETPPSWGESGAFVQVQEFLPSGDVKSYYSELLVVTLLLVASLCMLMASAAYVFRRRSSLKTALPGYAGTHEETQLPLHSVNPPSEDHSACSMLTQDKDEQSQIIVGGANPTWCSEEPPALPAM